jgi:hypothetical protein
LVTVVLPNGSAAQPVLAHDGDDIRVRCNIIAKRARTRLW